MLHKKSVTPALLGLIEKLQNDELLYDFFLVGGTALALQIGHRVSIDIDLFSQSSFDPNIFLEHLEQNYDFALQFTHKNTLKGTINGVFVDLITHNYPFVTKPIRADGLRMLSKSDIAAMKVNAISGDGTRAKDFIDIYFLLKEYSFGDIIAFYTKKYGKRNEFHAVKSLTYFNDMRTEAWPKMIREPKLTPEKVKQEITKQRDVFLSGY